MVCTLKGHCHAISVRCKMLKTSLNQEKPKNNEAVYLLRTVLLH